MSSAERSLTRVVGLVFLLLLVLGPVALLVVPSAVHVPGDAAATALALSESDALLRVGVLSEALIATSEVVMTVALFLLLRQASPAVALVSAGARLVMAALQGLGAGLGYALLMASEATRLDHGLLLLELREANVAAWQLFFALHCLTLAWLVWRSGRLPRVLGPLMAAAGLGYLAQSLVLVVLPAAASTVEAASAVAIMLGELPLFLWLASRGLNPTSVDTD